MRTFWKVLKIAIVPVTLLGLFIYLTLDYKTYDRFDLIDGMIEANGGGAIENGRYTNDSLGLYFDTPEKDGADWHIIKYTDQFTRAPTLRDSSRAEFAALDSPTDTDLMIPHFILRVRFTDIPFSRYRDETSEEFAEKMRDEYVSKTVSRLREDYKDTYIISDIEPKHINGHTFYKFTAHNMVDGNYYTSYIIKMYGFAYRFMFHSWDEPLDQHFIDELMYSVEFREPTVEFTIGDDEPTNHMP